MRFLAALGMTLEGKADSGCHPEAEPKDPFCGGRDLPVGRRLLMRFLAALLCM